jgi:hypothetical protein
MAFPFQFTDLNGETAVDIEFVVEDDKPSGSWTWLHSSRSNPVRLAPKEWPEGLAKSVDARNTARRGQEKGRVLIVRSGPRGQREALSPVAVMCCHVHKGNSPLAVLDLGYRKDVDAERGRVLVDSFLLSALADLNDNPVFKDRKVPRPSDRLGWAIRHQDGAGSDRPWGRVVARRAQGEWGFHIVKPKTARPSWAQDGFYGERPR